MIVEKVGELTSGEVGRVHCLPHHAVIRRDKETKRQRDKETKRQRDKKLRIVYDASCKSNQVSLDDCLYTGSALSQNIMDISLRF